MKNMFALALISTLLLAGCAPKAEKFALKEGSPAYVLAKDLAAIMPALGPDKVTVLAEAKGLAITAAEVIQAIQDNMGTRTAQITSVDAGELKNIIEQGATQIAERKILLAAAAGAKVTVPAEEFDKAMQSQYAQAGGEPGFLEALKGAGISIDHVKKSVQETLVISKYLEGIAAAGSKVTEADVRKAYQEETAGDKTATVRHILLLTQGKSDAEKAEARKKIEDILAKAKAGEDFAALAKQYSEDPGSKDNGGLYEDIVRGQMVKPFEDAAFSVPVGQISDVVEVDYGYHILQIVDRKKETRPFEEIRAEIESRLKEGKQGTVVEDHIKSLMDKAGFKLINL
ncbi:MAG TPA: peptidylprolyl isomerase [Candidatus Latescibacteria bacterium]|nr:peptidylprolyl isomerase [Candidatus Latescibacterota bacterium]